MKSVLASILTYTMQMSWLPSTITSEIHKAMRRFIWSKQGGARGWHLVRWDTLLEEKEHDSLAVRDMRLANTAMLGKAVWSLIHKPGKLWVRVLSHKYLRNSSLFQARASPSASPVWKRILRARDQLREGFKFRLGDGASSIWYSDWSGTGMVAEKLPYVHVSDTELCMADVIRNGNWNFDTLHYPPGRCKPPLHGSPS